LILAIDPGNIESAYVVIDDNLKPVEFGKVNNIELLVRCIDYSKRKDYKLAIEMVASYGMAVGEEIFETVFWIGRFWQAFEAARTKIYRKDEKMNLCHSMKANDSTITQALVDRFAYGIGNHGKGTKKAPGWFYGFKKDIWQAYAVGVTYHDMYLKEGE
jgi:hypothetical protein